MKKRFVLILAVAWAAVMLTGCLSVVQNRVENAETGLAASLFKTYSQQTGAENGIITVSVRNLAQEPVLLKIIMVDHDDAWKFYEIPASDILNLDLGKASYLLQVQHVADDDEFVPSDQVLVNGMDTVVEITVAASSPFNIYIPDLD